MFSLNRYGLLFSLITVAVALAAGQVLGLTTVWSADDGSESDTEESSESDMISYPGIARRPAVTRREPVQSKNLAQEPKLSSDDDDANSSND